MDKASLEQLLADLQSRYAFQEDLLTDLNAVVVEQGKQIALLERRCERLQGLLGELADEVAQASPAANERPPHY